MTKKLLTFLVLAFIINCVNAQNIQSLIKRSGNGNKYSGDNVLIIFDSTKVDVQETGLSYINSHKLYKILTTDGAKSLNVIKFDYDPLSAFVEIKEARIYRKNGKVEELNVKLVNDYPAPARMIYWGARQIMLEVGRLEPGDAVEVLMFRKGFTYALLQNESNNDDERYIPPMKGHFYDIVPFWSNDPIITKFYQVRIPDTKDVQFKVYNGDIITNETTKAGKKIYSFTKKNIRKIEKEPHMVALDDIATKLLISTSPDWEAKSTWFYGVNEDYGSFNSTPDIDKKVDEILAGAKDELDSVARLTHWVADNMRYSGISMGEGEGFTLHSGEMNFTDRCGVCKDKASLLITMLRTAGFESYAAMTMAGSRIDRIPADQFNHSVTVVKLSDGKYQLLDPTWVPFVRELWSSREQQQNYLIGTPDGSDLMETPISPAENHYYRLTAKTNILEDGTLEGEFIVTAEGQSDASIRGLFTRNYKSEWKSILEDELMKISPNIEFLELNYPEDAYDYSDPIQISAMFRIPNYAIVTKEEIIFYPIITKPIFSRVNYHLNFDTTLEERKYAFKDGCSRLVELNETITLPKFKEAIQLPEVEDSNGTGADFSGKYEVKGQTITLTETAKYKKRVYNPEDWDSYRKAVIGQKTFINEAVILKR